MRNYLNTHNEYSPLKNSQAPIPLELTGDWFQKLIKYIKGSDNDRTTHYNLSFVFIDIRIRAGQRFHHHS